MSFMVGSPMAADGDFPQRQTGGSILVPARKLTQEDQDKEDARAKRRAQHALEKLWMDRLQLISVITTFFAAIEAQLLSITTPERGGYSKVTERVANAGLAGALVFHTLAATTSFIAAFMLIHYRLQEAEWERHTPSAAEKQEIWCRDPHVAVENVGYLSATVPPMHLLQRFHTLCVSMAVAGFILAAAGILCIMWTRQALSVGVFSSACFVSCVLAGLVTLLVSSPETKY